MRERKEIVVNANNIGRPPPVMNNANDDSHAKYLKEFRVVQCPLFVQRKCTQHRPYACFNWHFMNQRRRRPIKRRDRTFNYSADSYCTKYDETTGICPDGDECPNLHRTAGDTERRYHLRYYKTCMCVHDTDNRGFCVKNGAHCAFAHGNHDLRPPIYDDKELQALENSEPDSTGNGLNALDKERNLMNEDPKWGDTTYVLSNYKTEQCKRPPRLCRQGYACPQFHNSKDKRRSPRKFKYRSTPCPHVKHGEEWGEPSNCESGDNCQYCHTRTEQQFHPEIYKSTKCNDVQTAGYCPRGVFCAFAHVDQDVSLPRELIPMAVDSGNNLADILSNALPSDRRQEKEKTLSDSTLAILQNGSGEISESASTSSLGSNGSHNKAPGAQLHQNSAQQKNLPNMMYSSSLLQSNDMSTFNAQMLGLDGDSFLSKSEKSQKKQNSFSPYNLNSLTSQPGLSSPLSSAFYHNDTVESVLGSALGDTHISDDSYFNLDSMERETNSPVLNNSISVGLASSGLLCSSAPVNIPGISERPGPFSNFSNLSPSTSPLQSTYPSTNFFSSGSRFSQQDSIESSMPFMNHVSETFSNHLSSGLSQSSGSASKLGGFNNSLFDFPSNHGISPSSRSQPLAASPLVNAFPISPSNNNGSTEICEIKKLREELASARSQLNSWYERIRQARDACSAWKIESGESKRKQVQAEKERDEAISKLQALQQEKEVNDLKLLSLADLKSQKMRLQNQLEEIEKAIKRIISPNSGGVNEVYGLRGTEQDRNPTM